MNRRRSRKETARRLQRAAVILIVLLITALSGRAQQEAITDYRDLTYPALSNVQVPTVTRVTLPSGMKILLLEDHELPLIRISARIRSGSVFEPPDKVGLAAIAGDVIRTGGTASMSGDAIDQALERMAASIETGIGLDYGWSELSVLSDDIDKALPIFADILMRPAFAPEKIELARIQQHAGIARRNDSPGQIAAREFHQLIYGEDSPLARYPEYATVDAVTRDDLIDFHERYFKPDATILAVWGDFEIEAMTNRLNNVFEGWEPPDTPLPPFPKVEYTHRRSVNLVSQPRLNQSTIFLGHIGGLKSDPDYFALVVMNQILGGGFTGRLFRNVRAREGLAYSVFGAYGTDYAHSGTFHVGCQTQSSRTIEAIRALVKEVDELRQKGVTAQEVAVARESFLSSFIFNFDTEAKIIKRLLVYEYYGYPADFLQQIRAGIEQVSREDVQRAARQHLHPDSVRILVVGNPAQFDESLSTLGQVNPIDISIPPPTE